MSDTRFQPGESGNPSGRPRGSRNKTTLMVEALLDGEAEAITDTVISLAKSGDRAAIRVCMDRLASPRRDRPVAFDFPPITTPADAVQASAAIANGVAAGDLTPLEAEALSKVVARYVSAVELRDIEVRLKALEQQRTAGAGPNAPSLSRGTD